MKPQTSPARTRTPAVPPSPRQPAPAAECGAQEEALALPLGAGVRVLARHASGLLAFEKPAGVASHPNNGGGDGQAALLDAAYSLEDECYNLKSGARLWLLNRLDSPTSGIVLAASSPALAATIQKLFREHSGAVAKTYHAVVAGGRLPLPSGIWRDKIATRQMGGVVRSEIGAGGFPSVTHFAWLATTGGAAPLSLLRLEPKTGRTHQLRVQCAFRHRPILGDKTYGNFALNRRLKAARMFLHASALALDFVWQGKKQHFSVESPLPPEFLALFPK